jgi:hypothetical protein
MVNAIPSSSPRGGRHWTAASRAGLDFPLTPRASLSLGRPDESGARYRSARLSLRLCRRAKGGPPARGFRAAFLQAGARALSCQPVPARAIAHGGTAPAERARMATRSKSTSLSLGFGVAGFAARAEARRLAAAREVFAVRERRSRAAVAACSPRLASCAAQMARTSRWTRKLARNRPEPSAGHRRAIAARRRASGAGKRQHRCGCGLLASFQSFYGCPRAPVP